LPLRLVFVTGAGGDLSITLSIHALAGLLCGNRCFWLPG